MDSKAKFYICGGGKWRELNLENGVIDGWGKPTFAYVRRGKFEVVKSKTVLEALRDHKNGLNSAVSVGAQLPKYKKVHSSKKRCKRLRGSSPCTHARCCHGLHINGYLPPPIKSRSKISPFKEAEINIIKKVDVEIQTNLTSEQSLFPKSKNTVLIKRRRQTTSSDENVQCNVTTAAMVHSRSPKKVTKIVMRKKWSIASLDKFSSTKLNKDSAKHDLCKRKRTNSSDSIVWDVLPNNKGSNAKDSSSEETAKVAQSKAKKNELYKTTLNSRLGLQKKSLKHRKIALDHVIGDKVKKPAMAKTVTSVEADIESKSKLTNATLNDKNVKKTAKADDVTELIIDETDLELLRSYFMNNWPDFDLLQFDAHDEYKRQVLYKIIPLVNIERCSKIADMLRRDSQDEISQKDFVYLLGLTSVSETSQPQRYKMRKTKERRNLDRESNKIHITRKHVNGGIINSHSNERNRRSETCREVSNLDTDTESEAQETTRQEKFVKRKRGRNEIKSAKKYAMKDAEVEKIRKATKRNKIRMFGSGTATENSTIRTVEGNTKTGNKDEEDEYSSVENTHSRILRERKSNNISIDLSCTSDDSEAFVKIAKHNIKEKNNTIKNKASAPNYDLDRLKTTKPSNRKSQNSRNFDANENNNKYVLSDKNKVINSTSNGQNIKHDKKINSANQTDLGNKNDLNISKNRKDNIAEPENNSDDDIRRSTRQNKINIDKLPNNKNNMADASDDNSIHDKNTRTTRQSQNKTDSRNDSKLKNSEEINKLKGRLSKTSPSKPNNKHDNTAETVNLSENDESEVFAKKPIISQVRSLVVKLNRTPSSSSTARVEYSNMEDHAIVSWVSQGGRPRCVNGNRIWRELQDQYYNISGQKRTWHSLRNRYLRSILPRLGSLALDPSLVARLRAAAATGEIKGRHKNSLRRNSIFGVASVGALSRRRRRSPSSGSGEELLPPKKHKHDNNVKDTPTRVLRSSLPSSTEQAARSPRYSDILKKYADRHRYDSTSTLSSTSSASRNNSPERENLRKSGKKDNTNNSKKSLMRTSQKSSVTKVSAPKDALKTKVSTPKDASSSKVSTPKDALKTKVSTPKDASSSKVSTPKDASSSKVSTPKDALKTKVSTPKTSTTKASIDNSRQTTAARDTLPENMKYLKERTKTRKLYNPISLL